jgi:hypothetical protein
MCVINIESMNIEYLNNKLKYLLGIHNENIVFNRLFLKKDFNQKMHII